eukprot:TRINITY_DN3945_c0_g1_i1.p1 TRINITY_DN3945_c0_g1~~TRINITY_DN3945_c0_g1_i1.p1  ORF type:complete len:289 (+),score=47.19 TRINITY_DN3945_c0_g1_i1:178-1044(+)
MFIRTKLRSDKKKKEVVDTKGKKKQTEAEKKEEEKREEKQQKKEEELAQKVYDVREELYKTQLHINLDDVVWKLHSVLWPGGGFVKGLSSKSDVLYWSTSGLSNPDMPNGIEVTDTEYTYDEYGRVINVRSKMRAMADPLRVSHTLAGYGVEIVVATKQDDPLNATSWQSTLLESLVQTLFFGKWDIYQAIERLGSYTYQDVEFGEDFPNGKGSFLLTPLDPSQLPVDKNHFELPNGKLKIIVASYITPDELKCALKGQGGQLLLEKFEKLGFQYQISPHGRESVKLR